MLLSPCRTSVCAAFNQTLTNGNIYIKHTNNDVVGVFDVLLLNFDTSVPTWLSHRLYLQVIKAEKFYCRLLSKYKLTKAAIATIKRGFFFLSYCTLFSVVGDGPTLFYVTIPRLLWVRY